MLETEDRFDRLVLWTVKHASPTLVFILAGMFYVGIGLAVPLALHWPLLWLVGANLVGVSLAFALITTWFAVQIEARDRRQLLDWTSDLRLLGADEFEWLVGELFRREGWRVIERGRQDAPDGNIDLELRRGPERRLVQCKRWQSRWVDVDDIRRFMGTLSREKLPMPAGIFVTLSDFNRFAKAEAKSTGLVLIGGTDLHARLEKVRRSETCGKCGRPMLLDHSEHGWWFRCVSPGCTGKRDLGKDPGRAVALVTEQR